MRVTLSSPEISAASWRDQVTSSASALRSGWTAEVPAGAGGGKAQVETSASWGGGLGGEDLMANFCCDSGGEGGVSVALRVLGTPVPLDCAEMQAWLGVRLIGGHGSSAKPSQVTEAPER